MLSMISIALLLQLPALQPPFSRTELRSFSSKRGTCQFEVRVLVSGQESGPPRRARPGEVLVEVSSAQKGDLFGREAAGQSTSAAVGAEAKATVVARTGEACLLTVFENQEGSRGLMPVVFGGPAGRYEVLVYLAPFRGAELLIAGQAFPGAPDAGPPLDRRHAGSDAGVGTAPKGR